MDRRKDVVLYKTLGQDDGVLEVVALPWHEGHDEVLSECEFTVIGGRTVSEDLALLNGLTLRNDGLLVNASVLVRAFELEKTVNNAALVLVLNSDGVAIDLGDGAVFLGEDHVCSIASSA